MPRRRSVKQPGGPLFQPSALLFRGPMRNGVDNAANGTGRPPASRQPLSPEAIESVSSWLRVIADPTRIRLMEILNAGSGSVQGLACQLGTSRPNVSKDLGV